MFKLDLSGKMLKNNIDYGCCDIKKFQILDLVEKRNYLIWTINAESLFL